MQTIPRGNCSYCMEEHENVSANFAVAALCSQCQVCYQYCEHMEGCTWPRVDTKPQNPASPATDAVRPDVSKVADTLATKNLQEAFESWYLSSNLLGKADTSPEQVYKEFELFAKEVLTPVDQSKRYLQIKIIAGKVELSGLLDAGKLHKNQDGDYVVVEGKRRTRIGKDVAVL